MTRAPALAQHLASTLFTKTRAVPYLAHWTRMASTSTNTAAQQQDRSSASSSIGKTQPIYRDGIWHNPWSTWHQNSLSQIVRFMFSRIGEVPVLKGVDMEKDLPVLTPHWIDDSNSHSQSRADHVYYTWIGHATALVEVYGLNILIDPVFSDRVAPFQWLGPKRLRPLPSTIEQLPEIDIIVISHNHYDHLDYNSCLALKAKGDQQLSKTGRPMHWYVGKGIEEWLIDNCNVQPETVTGMTWWQEVTHNSNSKHESESESTSSSSPAVITALPCQHWSGRTPRSQAQTLWVGFAICYRGFKLYYSGDTAYCSAFKEIGAHCGPFDLSVLPIGAYIPDWFMKYVHVGPPGAVQIHKDIQSKRSVAVHWATFILTGEPLLEPRQLLEEEAEKQKLKPEEFRCTKHGETIEIV